MGVDDNEQGVGMLGISVEEVGDSYNVGINKGEEVSGKGLDVGELVVVFWVSCILVVENKGDDINDNGGEEWEKMGFGFVNVVLVFCEVFDDLVIVIVVYRKG